MLAEEAEVLKAEIERLRTQANRDSEEIARLQVAYKVALEECARLRGEVDRLIGAA